MLTRLYYVSDLLESGDFLYDLYFGENCLVAVRSARKSLCRVAIGMAGVTISDKPLTMRQLTSEDSKNIFSIPYTNLISLKIEKRLQISDGIATRVQEEAIHDFCIGCKSICVNYSRIAKKPGNSKNS